MNPTVPEHRSGRGRLSIPYQTKSGPVGVTFRCIEDHNCKEIPKHSKYTNPPGQMTLLYGVNSIFMDTLDIALVEGQIDEITLTDLCGIPSLGIPGAKNWKPWWTHILSDFRRVFAFLDGDEAGEQLGNKIQKELGGRAILLPLPAQEDSNSMYLKYGPEYLKEMIK